MRLFTKLRAEQISTIAYPLIVVPAETTYPAETRSSSDVARAAPQNPAGESFPQTIRATDGTTKVVNNQSEKNAALGVTGSTTYDPNRPTAYNPNNPNNPTTYDPNKPGPSDPNKPVKSEPEVQKVVITTIHRESYESPKDDVLLSPKVADRKDPEGPIVGDWYVTDYDIMTDKVIRKVYDNETFQQYFKASIGG